MVSKANAIQKLDHMTPTSMRKALVGPNGDQWLAAKEAEHVSLEIDKTFEFVNRSDVPNGTKIIKSSLCFEDSHSCRRFHQDA